MSNFTYFNTLILCVWLQVINKVKFIHQGEGHIRVKVKYRYLFKFYVAHTLCKWVVCIRLKCVLVHQHDTLFEQIIFQMELFPDILQFSPANVISLEDCQDDFSTL